MTSRDFAFWLQGLFELSNPTTLDEKQTELIKRHLDLVFVHEIDPAMGDKKHQDILNKIHQGKTDEDTKIVDELINLPPHYYGESNGVYPSGKDVILRC